MTGEKWIKHSNGWEWNKRTDAYKAEIAKVAGTGTGRPYRWDIRLFPRPAGRWPAFGQGSCATLAEAKAASDRAIAQIADSGDGSINAHLARTVLGDYTKGQTYAQQGD